MNSKRQRRHLFIAIAATVLGLGTEAHAIIGRPLTPMSYAGVARRTTRRAAYVGAGAAAAGAAYGGYYGAPPVTALPAGCAPGVPCGGSVYQPYYSGPTVVYVPR
jgi:hypothetical protein